MHRLTNLHIKRQTAAAVLQCLPQLPPKAKRRDDLPPRRPADRHRSQMARPNRRRPAGGLDLDRALFTAFSLADVRGEDLLHPARPATIDMSKVKLSSTDALKVVVEDQPTQVILRALAGIPVHEIRAPIGIYLIGAETGEVTSPLSEDLARQVATSAWMGKGKLLNLELLKDREKRVCPAKSGRRTLRAQVARSSG